MHWKTVHSSIPFYDMNEGAMRTSRSTAVCTTITAYSQRRPMGIGVLLVLVAVVLASCDAVTATEPITLQSKTVSFRFEFDSEGVSPGGSVDAQSNADVDLGPELLSDGFTKAEVITATVTSVELERISPTQVNLNFLEEASIDFAASGISTRTIAGSNSLPDSRTAMLSVTSANVTTFVVAPSFRAVLNVVPESVPEGEWVLRSNVTLRIDVEGV